MLDIYRSGRDVRVALLGRAVSTFGDGVALVALTLRLQGDGAQPYEVGLLLAAGGLPQLLVAGRVGRLVDSHDSRRLLLCGGGAATAATIPLVFVHSVGALLALMALIGAATSLTATTWSVLLPRLAGDDDVAAAISAQQSLNVLMLVAAPAVGALLTSSLGTGVALVVDAATFLIMTAAAATVGTWRIPPSPPKALASSPIAPEVAMHSEPDAELTTHGLARGGFAILRDDHVLAPLLIGVALVVLVAGMADVVLVYLVRESLHAASIWYGSTEASWMAGMVIGSASSARIRTDRQRVRACIAGAAVACAALAGFAGAPTVTLLIALSVAGGVGNGYAATCMSTLLMTRTPETARGRVSAAAGAILGSAQGGAILAGSLLAIALNPPTIYAIAGLLGLAVTALVALTIATHKPADLPPRHVHRSWPAASSRIGARTKTAQRREV